MLFYWFKYITGSISAAGAAIIINAQLGDGIISDSNVVIPVSLQHEDVGVGTVTIGSGGSGYVVNDLCTINQTYQGGGLCTLQVTSVSSGVVTGLSIIDGGVNYPVANGLATTTSGSGTGLTVNVTSLSDPSVYSVLGVIYANPSGGAATSFQFIGVSGGNITDFRIAHYSSQDVLLWCTTQYNAPTSFLSPAYNACLVYMAQATDVTIISGPTRRTWGTNFLWTDLSANSPPTLGTNDVTSINSLSLGTNLDGNPGLLVTTWAGYYIPVVTSTPGTLGNVAY